MSDERWGNRTPINARDTSWHYTEHELPPENVLLETTNSQGDVGELIRIKNLFFLPDKSMYVYYTPKMWRIK